MVHAAEFRNGRLTVRNRWVRTDAWQTENAAGAATHWGIRDSMMGRTDKPMRDAANTDLVAHRGKVLDNY